MQTWKDSGSPWGKQIRFDAPEFEVMMDDLRYRAGEGSFVPGHGVDVDLVLLRGFGIEADYVDLPAGVMGRTIFARDGSARIEISRPLSEAAGIDDISRRRLRTTLAHECGHVACHCCLFVQDTETLSLFGTAGSVDAAATQPILCREEGIGSTRYNGHWWEYQANQCMAALLLPRDLVGASVRRDLNDRGLKSFADGIVQGVGDAMVKALANEYDVSLTATLFRLQALGFVPMDAQGQLSVAD